MRSLVKTISSAQTPESLVEQLHGQPGIVLLRSGLFDSSQARYSFVTARPFLCFRAFGSRCEIRSAEHRSAPLPANPEPGGAMLRAPRVQFGDPWRLLESLMSEYELLEEIDLPFPLGGCFGFWGYELKNFVEPKLPRRASNDLDLPDCQVGFYDSLVVFDHRLGQCWIVSTGLGADGSRSETCARLAMAFWEELLHKSPDAEAATSGDTRLSARRVAGSLPALRSNLSRNQFVAAVERARDYIHAGDIYQVNLSHRLTVSCDVSCRDLFQALSTVSPAPFSAFLDCGDFQIASSSPEQFLRMSGSSIVTRPIKGTRPRSADPTRDAQLAYELQTSSKEMAELVMITDLLRNDLGKICEFGSVQVPELVRLERYPQVQHLVSTVEGRLRAGLGHFPALASCFPGGSITGAPKFRAMEIIDELEPTVRGPYTGALGYLGFNRESQLSIIIRTALCKEDTVFFPVGAGIVADSNPQAEYEETLAKARGFLDALRMLHLSTAMPADGIPAAEIQQHHIDP